MRHIALPVIAVGLLALGGARAASGAPEGDQGAVAARVGSVPIYAGEVARMVGKVSGRREIHPSVRPVVEAQVLSEIVDRQLVLAYSRRTNSGPTEAEVDAAVADFKSRLQLAGKSPEDYLAEQGIAEAGLRRQIAWKVTWRKYAARYVTEERIESFFEAHRREFDGTEVSVGHILLRPRAGAGPEAIDELVERAESIRREIVSGATSFAAAARKHSAGPSAKDGGQLGFIGRRGPMVESFSRAAFALEPGELSEPVVTAFGVHLIRCEQIKPGTKQVADAREALEEALARELLEKVARLEERHTPVEFTGATPYFKRGTRELVRP